MVCEHDLSVAEQLRLDNKPYNEGGGQLIGGKGSHYRH